MKFSELWLREWCNTSMSSEMLFNNITMLGLEVSEITTISKKFNGIIVGEIIECTKYKKLNNLVKTKINIGNKKFLNIFCRATNCRKGLKTAVAKIEHNLSKNLKIKKNKIHEEYSDGILCSNYDLGISENQKKIIELSQDAIIGANIEDYLKLYDNIIEINITPNRADCLSILGIARDLAAINKLKLNKPLIHIINPTIKNTFPIKIENPEACPRFLSRIIRNINCLAKTPIWIKEKLQGCGIQTKSTITDIINYVLIELGQPQNVYDLDKLDTTIFVRMAGNEEKITLENNTIIKLKPNTLVIADKSKILGIAGVISSTEALISTKTKNILLECSFFNPKVIIKHTQNYEIKTDISYRFERGVDYKLQCKTIERTSALILKICGGNASNIIDITNKHFLPKTLSLTLTRNKLNRIIGYFISNNLVIDILTRIGCKVSVSTNSWNITVPSWRFDIQTEENLAEEIARIYGYNNIKSIPLHIAFTNNQHKKTSVSLNRIKTLLVDRGFNEAITYSFVNPEIHTLLHTNQNALTLLNPISHNMSIMRLSLWTGLLNAVIYNQKRQQNRIKLFESGVCFIPDTKSEYGVRQELMLACIVTGNKFKEHWSLEKQQVDFFDLKGDIEAILDLINKSDKITFNQEKHTALHPGESAGIYLKNKHIGFIGLIHPFIEQKLNLRNRCIMFEIYINLIEQNIIQKVKTISQYPINRRDISIVIPKDITAGEVLEECKKINKNNIVTINLFDVYSGKGIEEGHKSFAISLIFQNFQRTMEEKDITNIVNLYIATLKKRFNAYLRK
ncbi:Phenylalanine--tRNA ligase beta subunit [Candidatus Providencia siddallii]|uniref:Phenylalanine--tRNA ligase beta subunit n=1 Tax=Candidatus Providencia siddallii TaxID=1715285 RepID=A0A0M6W9P6_9GAMM|nr:Phenylalanine--tRNA ligase beta subunit [Candidatus Providencia siddallii]